MADNRVTLFQKEIIRAMQQIDEIFDNAENWEEEWFDVYSTLVTDASMAQHNLTAANFTTFITLIQQFKNMAVGTAITNADYQTTTNVAKRATV